MWVKALTASRTCGSKHGAAKRTTDTDAEMLSGDARRAGACGGAAASQERRRTHPKHLQLALQDVPEALALPAAHRRRHPGRHGDQQRLFQPLENNAPSKPGTKHLVQREE